MDDQPDQAILGRSGPSTRDLTPWYFTAAVFWFVVVGFLAAGFLVVASPFACWGDPIGPPGSEPPCNLVDGNPFLESAVTLVGLLVVAAISAGLLWAATVRRRRARAVACVVLGLVASVPVVLMVSSDLGIVVLAFLWTGVPALLLFRAAIRLWELNRLERANDRRAG